MEINHLRIIESNENVDTSEDGIVFKHKGDENNRCLYYQVYVINNESSMYIGKVFIIRESASDELESESYTYSENCKDIDIKNGKNDFNYMTIGDERYYISLNNLLISNKFLESVNDIPTCGLEKLKDNELVKRIILPDKLKSFKKLNSPDHVDYLYNPKQLAVESFIKEKVFFDYIDLPERIICLCNEDEYKNIKKDENDKNEDMYYKYLAKNLYFPVSLEDENNDILEKYNELTDDKKHIIKEVLKKSELHCELMKTIYGLEIQKFKEDNEYNGIKYNVVKDTSEDDGSKVSEKSQEKYFKLLLTVMDKIIEDSLILIDFDYLKERFFKDEEQSNKIVASFEKDLKCMAENCTKTLFRNVQNLKITKGWY